MLDKSWKNKLILLLSLVILLLAWALAWLGRDEFQNAHEDDDKAAVVDQSPAPPNTVLIDEQAQKQTGISVEPLQAATYSATQNFTGVVLDMRALVEARQRLQSLSAQLTAAQAQLLQRRNDVARTQGLYDEGRNASQRDLEATRAALATQEQQELALQADIRSVIDGVRMQWGDTFAQRLGDKDGLVARVISHQVEIIQFAMPYGSRPEKQLWRVDVSNSGLAQGVPAVWVGGTSQSQPGLQGSNWLLSAPNTGAGAGTRVRVLSQQGKPQNGVLVPSSAMIRFAGKNWVYVKTQAEQFERMALPVDRPLAEGFFTDAFKTNDLIVSSGAQLLLSEEFRFQIKNENQD